MFRNKAQHIHFVGIGGIGMSGIAEVLWNLGFVITGSDIAASSNTARLAGLGVQIFIGHQSPQVGTADVVVVSSAIAWDNPEVLHAHRQKIPVVQRGTMLAELMRLKYGIAVAGMHGKTTTTSLVATLLEGAGLDPTVVLGGRFLAHTKDAYLGQGEYLVAEADESDGSFLALFPTIAVVTNLDAEHLDYYRGGIDEISEAFVKFMKLVPFYGATIACIDQPIMAGLLRRLQTRVLTYGLSLTADIRAHHLRVLPQKVFFQVSVVGEDWGEWEARLMGQHNVQNALAAIAVGYELGIGAAVMKQSLKNFAGIKRRFEIKGDVGGVLVVDDYAHHPAEIKATLKAAAAAYPKRRLVVVFQPHRYSRTAALFDDFVHCFTAGHVLLIADIYPAGEAALPGVSSEMLAAAIAKVHNSPVHFVGSLQNCAAKLMECVAPTDVVMTLGAGSIYQAGEQLLQHLSSV